MQTPQTRMVFIEPKISGRVESFLLSNYQTYKSQKKGIINCKLFFLFLLEEIATYINGSFSKHMSNVTLDSSCLAYPRMKTELKH